MTADLPWFNSKLGNLTGRSYDEIPGPHAMYYINLSLFSTFLLALIVGITLALLATIWAQCRPESKQRVHVFKSFLYNFFILGAVIAGCLSAEGALLNPI